MTMLSVFDKLIAFCEKPPPVFAGDTHILGFHIQAPRDSEFVYNGLAVMRHRSGPLREFQLEGFGTIYPSYTTPTLPAMVRLSVPIGRHNPTETTLQFGDISRSGGLGDITQEELCDASAERQGDWVILTFVNGSFERVVRLFKTNLLRTY